MKKKMFIAFSAVSIFVVGLLVVACSPDSNAPSVASQPVVQYSSSQAEGSDADWADFQAAVEALNAQYVSPAQDARNSRYLDPGIMVVDPDFYIPNRDIIGALNGLEMTRTVTNGRYTYSVPGTVIQSVVYSYYAFRALRDSADTNVQASISVRDLKMISHLNNSDPSVELGKRHNQLLVSMLDSNFDSSNMTYPQVVQAFINKYEQLYAAVPASVENQLRGDGLVRVPIMSTNVQQANASFHTTTSPMSIATKRSYTDEYIDIVNNSQVAAYDKLQMCTYAGVSYYSGALWIVQ